MTADTTTASQIWLTGSDEPLWVDGSPDFHALTIAQADPSDLLAVTSLYCHSEDDEPYCEERTAYIRADQVACITPLGPKARAHLAEARGD